MSFAAGATGGEYKHKLTTSEIPAHKHTTPVAWDVSTGASDAIRGAGSLQRILHQTTNAYGLESWNTGGNGSHNNVQPYQTVYFWRRTA